MPLTTFIKEKDVREKLKQQFPKPKFTLKKEILAPPKTNRYALVGTAFDYVLRFYLKHTNPQAITSRWAAEQVLEYPYLLGVSVVDVWINLDSGEVSWSDPDTDEPVPFTGLALQISETIKQAKQVYNDYLTSGQMTDEVLRNALLLAQIDPIYRSRYVDENIGQVHQEDINDLRELFARVKPETFKTKEVCILNPTFGKASGLVGGADADLIIDDMLIDIKTVKDLKLTLDNFLQVMGYYVLYKIDGIDNAPQTININRVGIYFSRYAELYSFDINDVIDPETLQPFIDWFKARASRRS